MDDYRLNSKEEQGIFHIEVDEAAKATLLETARWTKFLGIIGIVALSLLLLAGLSMSALMSSADSPYSPLFTTMGITGVIVYILVVIAVQVYPVYSMLTFSKEIKHALNAGDKTRFNNALGHLKGLFKYMGIITIIAISLYGLVIIFAIIGAAMH